MRDDDLFADGLSETPQVPLRGVRAVARAVVVPAIALAASTSMSACVAGIISADAPPPADAPTEDAPLDVPRLEDAPTEEGDAGE